LIPLAVVFLGMTRQESGGPRTAITAPKGPKGFSASPGDSSFFLFSLANGRFRLVPPGQMSGPEAMTEIRLILPPPPTLRDEGAIEAAVEIVVSGNPTLSAVLARAGSRWPPGEASGPQVPGELYLRIRKPAAANGHRLDIPADAFAARSIRSTSYPQFQPGEKR
jgi:hypothetical protein